MGAGESRRMGRPKQILPLQTTTILGQVIENVQKSNIDEVVLVLGHQAAQIANQVRAESVQVAINPEFRQGMSSSIKCGLRVVSRETKAVMIVLGDQPWIDAEIINHLIEEHKNSDIGITVPTHKGVRGNPVTFDMKYKHDLMHLKGDVGGKHIVERHPEDVLEIEIDSQSIIEDIDTESDYRFCRGGSN
ncbi:MAG: nucleotidyltransferase family protein [Chloroflexota bacterium]